MDCFDDTGIMALICHHDIPLFFANIDMPGEQQKYSVTLLKHLFSHLPVTATVVALYDIGCILTCSLDKADLEVADQALQAACTIIEKDVTEDTLEALESLECSHDHLLNKVDLLYASLNIHDKFPELNSVNIEFIWMLLLACDLKINVWKQAIGSFFEWDKLDHTVGGKQKALGMKLHQQTHKAIAKHQPTLMSAIQKFNMYCECLAKLYDASSGIPLPLPLPTKLAELCNDQSLFKDVWITPSIGEILRWLQDSDMREDIRAVLKTDCCLEEQHCLGMEADNMCQWFGSKLCAVKLAIQQPEREHTLDSDQTVFTDILEDVPSNADEGGLSNNDEDQKKIHNMNLVWEIPFISSIQAHKS
ncbi:hypothetical protein F5J12DRAFT_899644 [Pisolithus orientalis]|uniref:uncharacterized protein n=1 Tax=Pisolithus orientalis TaxID=936130 RepID=UPI00222439A8|nr:uncharacterized protein F5J12DRAFT_899644 [Pisolithus orientalis]KAI5983564.1 hypothetical protein F5J12DRAFT_899644 [Pisolithus orientalis]